MSLKNLRVGIVGGSVAGRLNAYYLMQAGASVKIFERSSSDAFTDRGAGIGVPTPHIQTVLEQNLFDEDLLHTHVPHFTRIVAHPDFPEQGRVIMEQPVDMSVINWAEIFRQTAKHIGDDVFQYNAKVVSTSTVDDQAVIELDGGEKEEFDFVIGADGYQSTVRQCCVAPDARLEPAGYVLWRGWMAEETMVANGLNPASYNNPLYLVHIPHHGHLVLYYVALPEGKRRMTWGLYINVPAEEMAHVLTDREGRVHEASLPAGSVREELEQAWKAHALEHLPADFARVIAATQDTFVQGIFDLEVDALVAGRVLLSGDAAFVARPHTVAGFAKAQSNAAALVAALESANGDVLAALADYNASQTEQLHKAVELGKSLGNGTVVNMPDQTDWTKEQMLEWLGSMMVVTGKYNYKKD